MIFGEGAKRIADEVAIRPVSPLFALGIFFFPVICVWWLLRDGHTLRARLLGFGWLFVSLSFGYIGADGGF